jgi:hypothetical protein
MTTPCDRSHGGPGEGKKTNAQEPRLFSEKPQRDRSVEKAEAEWTWREKIRAKTKPIDELPLFRRQREMF